MSEQQFCLKWSNFHSNMSEVFHNMLQSESMVDVTIACEGASLKAHKMILAACSPFFQSLFMSNPCKHPIVILKDVRFVDLKATIDFMYKGEVSVSQSQLGSVLKAAETLKIKGLADVVQRQRDSVTSCIKDSTTTPIHTPKKRRKNRKHKNQHDASSPSGSGDESSNEMMDSAVSNDSRSPAHKNAGTERVGMQEVTSDSHSSHEDSSSHMPPPTIMPTDVTTIENGQEDIIIAAEHATLIDQQSLRQLGYEDSSQHHTLPVVTVAGNNELSQLVLETEGDQIVAKTRRTTLRRTSAYARAIRFSDETFYESYNQLYCKACGEVVNHMKASVIKYHIKSQKHQLNKKRMTVT